MAVAGPCACQPTIAQQVVRTHDGALSLDIGTAGEVTKATSDAGLPPTSVAPVAQAVARRRFMPVMRDGKVATARTYALVDEQLGGRPAATRIRVPFQFDLIGIHHHNRSAVVADQPPAGHLIGDPVALNRPRDSKVRRTARPIAAAPPVRKAHSVIEHDSLRTHG